MMIETFIVTYPGEQAVQRHAHVGVVSSGDLELLLEPNPGTGAEISVTTRVSGHRHTWEAVLQRFFERHPYAVKVEIRDNGATPGTVWLRLEQGLELATRGPQDG
jgi:malonate decarboxylase delta subunit